LGELRAIARRQTTLEPPGATWTRGHRAWTSSAVSGSANPGTLGATKPARRLLVTALSAQDSAPPPTFSKGLFARVAGAPLWVAASQVLPQGSLYLDLDHTEAAEALEAAATIRPAASRTAATVRTATLAAASTDLRREVSVRARAGALPTVVLGRIVMLGTILAVLLLAAVDSTILMEATASRFLWAASSREGTPRKAASTFLENFR